MGELIVPKTYKTGTIAASQTNDTDLTIEPMRRNDGFFSLQSTLTGSGTAKIQYQVSNDGDNWNTGATDIVTAQTAGTAFYTFAPPVAAFMRILVTETSTTDSVSLVMTLAVQ
jgi:hypothetical protein